MSPCLVLKSFSRTGPPRRVDCMSLPPVNHVKTETFRYSAMAKAKDTTSKLASLFSTLSLSCGVPSREAVTPIFFSLLV